ncbi:hypothetical protein TcBrA4_0016280 [Trypanosoma cruzi]|nr:hypothetical protein TcBrA4_0016280 [Trypanosoma cruzi]
MGENRSVALPLPPRIDPSEEHYPFCIVWTPIPVLSWIFPFIGHVGICDSAGRIHDFEGPYHIGVDKMLFGNPVNIGIFLECMFQRFTVLRARTANDGGDVSTGSGGIRRRSGTRYEAF